MNRLRLAFFLLTMAWSAASMTAETRIALVIGNSNYTAGALPNPANDAKMIGDTLRGLGFEVIPRTNADQTTMKRAIQEFGARLEKAGAGAVGLFYYAGHGVQLNGKNYLIPTTARIEREGDVEIEAVSADWVIEQMRYARNRLNIMILDACRNNPFIHNSRALGGSGLATIEAPAGILIAYSTAPGSVATDGSGRDSPYAEALSRAMRDVHEPVEQMFKHVRVGVMDATSGNQVPWESSSLTGDFYFAAPPATAARLAAAPEPALQPASSPANPAMSLLNPPAASAHGFQGCSVPTAQKLRPPRPRTLALRLPHCPLNPARRWPPRPRLCRPIRPSPWPAPRSRAPAPCRYSSRWGYRSRTSMPPTAINPLPFAT